LPADADPGQPVTLGNAEYTSREIAAGLAALRGRFPDHVSRGPLVYAGFSLGARLGVEIVSAAPQDYPLVALGEGGYDALTQSVADAWAAAGVRRVLLICSTQPCEHSFGRMRRRLEQADIATLLAASGGVVHRFRGAVVDSTRAAWPWLIGEDVAGSSSSAPTPSRP
jgi:hypothetical protein